MQLFKTVAVLAGMLLSQQSVAADNRYDPTQYGGKGGFAPVTNEVYAKECGSCHFAYLPGFLPARSWDAILAKTDSHFGESLGLSSETLQTLQNYLRENAADHSDRKGPEQLMTRQPADVTPLRVTDIHMMRRNHVVVREVLRTNATVKVRSLTNCDGCHRGAKNGSFALRELEVPGL
jgi:hypothetical protein